MTNPSLSRQRLGAYEVGPLIGVGGMGEVYRARDTKLNRDIAIKVLLTAVAGDAERLARFRREAQTLASLNHPGIAQIHGLEDSTSGPLLVMELVEGPTLADRILTGAIPVDEAIAVARQIVDALEAAHERGVIHRDLKPANIKIRDDGTVKILDFGLAKALDPAAGRDAGSMANSPTITSPAMTQAGLILGTAGYMSPEQAKGRVVDKRTDIWAFGCVLYEMLTGRRAFDGEDVTDMIAFVITKEPDWTVLPAAMPEPMRRLLRRCLQKDRKQRLADIADARIELEDARVAPVANVGGLPQRKRAGWHAIVPWLIAAAALIALGVLAGPWRRPAPAPMRFTTVLGASDDPSLVLDPGNAVAISPDGRLVAFVAGNAAAAASPGRNVSMRLYVRPVGAVEATALAGTENATAPFFSPDGAWIGFFADGALKKIAASGGAAVRLCAAPQGRGGSWAEDDTIVFSPNTFTAEGALLMRVSAAGGVPESASTFIPGDVTHRWPQVLPGGDVLYTAHTSGVNFDGANLVVERKSAGAPRIVVRGGYFGRYVSTGHLLYVRDATLFAVPFNLDRLETTGLPVPVIEQLRVLPRSGAAHFAVATDGTLAYASGADTVDAHPLHWITRAGTDGVLRADAAAWMSIMFSPDGSRLAMTIEEPGQINISVYDIARDVMSRVTTGRQSGLNPFWTADGRWIAYTAQNEAETGTFVRAADGTGPSHHLAGGQGSPGSWHPSGTAVAMTRSSPARHALLVIPVERPEPSGWKAGAPQTIVESPARIAHPMFSPDGRWLAYHSLESGTSEVYVQPYGRSGAKVQISSGGGAFPTWSKAKAEILFVSDGRLMSVTFITDGGVFRPDRARPWSPQVIASRGTTRPFDLHPDGERVAAALPRGQANEAKSITIVLNWFEDLKRRMARPGAP